MENGIIKALVTGTGAMGVGEGLVKCLKMVKNKYYILATNMNQNAPIGAICDDFSIVPAASDNRYIHHMLEICERNAIDFLISYIYTLRPDRL